MTHETIMVRVDGGVATLTLNRPQAMNAWTPTMAIEVCDALAELDADDAVRVIIITGEGRAFCAGADLGTGDEAFQAAEGDVAAGRRAMAFPRLLPYQLTKPVIAALAGHAIGVGLTFAMTCDVRVCASGAKYQFAFVRRGITPELGSHFIVPRVAGLSNAADLMLSGRIIDGEEMVRRGLATAAVPAEQVMDTARAMAAEYLLAAPVSVAIVKRLLWDGLTMGVEEMEAREFPLFKWVCGQPDAREGVMSFLEKRPPRWTMSASGDLPPELKKRT